MSSPPDEVVAALAPPEKLGGAVDTAEDFWAEEGGLELPSAVGGTLPMASFEVSSYKTCLVGVNVWGEEGVRKNN